MLSGGGGFISTCVVSSLFAAGYGLGDESRPSTNEGIETRRSAMAESDQRNGISKDH